MNDKKLHAPNESDSTGQALFYAEVSPLNLAITLQPGFREVVYLAQGVTKCTAVCNYVSY